MRISRGEPSRAGRWQSGREGERSPGKGAHGWPGKSGRRKREEERQQDLAAAPSSPQEYRISFPSFFPFISPIFFLLNLFFYIVKVDDAYILFVTYLSID